MSFVINFQGKTLNFRDSWAMISNKLSDFPAMFDIKGIQKEIYPYNYYNRENISRGVGVINEAGASEIIPWSEKDYELFISNVKNIPGCKIDENHFNMELYCKFYCNQDVNILKQGHMKFRELCMKELNLKYEIASIPGKQKGEKLWSILLVVLR